MLCHKTHDASERWSDVWTRSVKGPGPGTDNDDMKLMRAPGLAVWASAMVAAGTLSLVMAAGPVNSVTWEAPLVAFVVVVIITVLCAVAAAIVIVTGWRRGLAELSILGAGLAGASILPLVHGLTIPGVLYGPNNAVMIGAFVAVPFFLLVAAPILVPRHPMSVAIALRWRIWTCFWVALSLVFACVLLIAPNLVPAPTMGTPLALLAVLASLAGTLVISLRHLRLFQIGRIPASLAASIGFAYLGFSMLAWLGTPPFSPGWWFAHAADAAGVLAATIGLWVAHHRDRDVAVTLSPVVNTDPLVALELGLTPVVHRYIAALATKDKGTRDHVVRVADLAMRCGVRAGLTGADLRALGLGALLHDIGKLSAPIEILTKPGALTPEEFDAMKLHTVWGESMMESSSILRPAAKLVRWHHERVDGAGYPDGLVEREIPLEVAIISVCDAWDAMTWTRPYRQGLAPADAMVVLHEHAGTQWASGAVGLVTAEIEASGPSPESAFERVGSEEQLGSGDDHLCDCFDALPAFATA